MSKCCRQAHSDRARHCGQWIKKSKNHKMDLNDLLKKVNSRQSFLDFVAALRDDKIDEEQKEKVEKTSPYGPGANGWENGTIETFLDAVHSFGQDNSKITEQADWKTFALLLFAGKFYE